MVAGQLGLPGLSVHLSVILGFRLENISAALLLLSMEAAAAWDLTYKPETATLSPAQVPLLTILTMSNIFQNIPQLVKLKHDKG